MEFHEYKSFYDLYKQFMGKNISCEEFYTRERRGSLLTALTEGSMGRDNTQVVLGNVQAAAESDWYKVGQPYYKIYPDLLPYFLTTKLNVPCEYFRLPFPAILIRIPTEHSIATLKIDEQYYVKTILVSSVDADPSNPSLVFDRDGVHLGSEHRQVVLWIDINEHESSLDVPIYTYQQLLFGDPQQTAEDAVAQCKNKTRRHQTPDGEFLLDGGIPVPYKLIDACWRIVIAVSFLSTGGDKIVEFDVLNRDLSRYLEALLEQNEPRQQQIVDRAKRNGKHGYTLGRELLFPHIISHTDNEREYDETGRELEYQHQRGAHWHWVRHGPGRALMKLVFYKQLTVRPDLPPKSSAKRGYHTPA